MLMKYAFRQVLNWIADQLEAAKTTPTGLDDILWTSAYTALRNLGLGLGFVDDGGPDDRGPLDEPEAPQPGAAEG